MDIEKELQVTLAEQGADGTSQYTFIRYAIDGTGADMTDTPTNETKYIGFYTGSSSICPDASAFIWSKYVGAVDEDPPTIPTINEIISTDTGNLKIEFEGSTDEYGKVAFYSVYRKTADTEFVCVGKVIHKDETVLYYVEDSIINKGLTYYYAITATDDAGNESSYSEIENCISKVTVTPYKCSNLNAIALNENMIILKWSEPDTSDAIYKPDSYTVEINRGNDTWVNLGKVHNNEFSYYYDRSVDKYPESEDLSNYKFRVSSNSIYETISKAVECSVGTTNYGTFIINKPTVTAVAYKEYIQIDWKLNDNSYLAKKYNVSVDGSNVATNISATSFVYVIDQLDLSIVKNMAITVTAISDAYSVTSAEINPNVDNYLGYEVTIPDLYISSSGRSANLKWDEQNVFDWNGVDLQIAKAYKLVSGVYTLITNSSELVWYAPALGLNPYESYDNYKKGDTGGYLQVKGSSVSFSLPLYGQNETTPVSVNTMYAFRIRAKSSLHTSSWSSAYFIEVKCTSAYDVVKAWDLNDSGEKVKLDGALGVKQIFVEELAALSANLGYITDGAMKGDAYNYWAVNDTKLSDGSTLYKGEFRVGGAKQYIKVTPIMSNGVPTGEFNVDFVVNDVTISSAGTVIKNNSFTVLDNDGNIMFKTSNEKNQIQVNEGTFTRNDSSVSKFLLHSFYPALNLPNIAYNFTIDNSTYKVELFQQSDTSASDYGYSYCYFTNQSDSTDNFTVTISTIKSFLPALCSVIDNEFYILQNNLNTSDYPDVAEYSLLKYNKTTKTFSQYMDIIMAKGSYSNGWGFGLNTFFEIYHDDNKNYYIRYYLISTKIEKIISIDESQKSRMFVTEDATYLYICSFLPLTTKITRIKKSDGTKTYTYYPVIFDYICNSIDDSDWNIDGILLYNTFIRVTDTDLQVFVSDPNLITALKDGSPITKKLDCACLLIAKLSNISWQSSPTNYAVCNIYKLTSGLKTVYIYMINSTVVEFPIPLQNIGMDSDVSYCTGSFSTENPLYYTQNDNIIIGSYKDYTTPESYSLVTIKGYVENVYTYTLNEELKENGSYSYNMLKYLSINNPVCYLKDSDFFEINFCYGTLDEFLQYMNEQDDTWPYLKAHHIKITAYKYYTENITGKKVYEAGVGFKSVLYDNKQGYVRYLLDSGAFIEFDKDGNLVAKGKQGDKGDKGETGASGSSLISVTATESSESGGNNVVTFINADGTKTTFNVKNGKDITIKSTSITYQASSSGTTVPTGTWSATIPTVTKGQYLWTKIVVTYSTGTTNTSYAVGYIGKDGTGVTVSSSAITYQASSSGTTVPTGSWSASVPTVTKGYFLWTKTVITYSDSTTSTSYSVGYAGTNGTGVSISSTSVSYQASSSGTTTPTGNWSTTVPSVTKGQYLWTKTSVTYSDKTSTTSYSVGYMGKDGSTNTITMNGATTTTPTFYAPTTAGTSGQILKSSGSGAPAWSSVKTINGNSILGSGNIAFDTVPIGTILPFGGTSPTGYLLCDGTAVSRTTYASLYAVIGTKYGTGDGSTTFNLPNLVGKFPQGATTSNLGSTIAAGLPNIIGTAYTLAHNEYQSNTGAFTSSTFPNNTAAKNGSGAGYGTKIISIKASDGEADTTGTLKTSDKVYGQSDTVQPPAVAVNYYIKAVYSAGNVSADATIDDSVVSASKLWSSNKINSVIGSLMTTGSNSNGNYITFANGLKIQWGTLVKGSNLAAGSTWAGTITFPTAFNAASYTITFGSYTSSTTSGENASGEEIYAKTKTTSNVGVTMYNRNSSTISYMPQINWIAIGY